MAEKKKQVHRLFTPVPLRDLDIIYKNEGKVCDPQDYQACKMNGERCRQSLCTRDECEIAGTSYLNPELQNNPRSPLWQKIKEAVDEWRERKFMECHAITVTIEEE